MAHIVSTGYYAPWHLAPRRDIMRVLARRRALGALVRLGRHRSMRRLASFVPWSSLCGFPLVVCVELTNRCDLGCVMCHRSFMDRPLGDMDWGRFASLAAEMGRERGTMLVFIGQGEPTLYPRFLDALRLGKESGIDRILLQTNGQRLLEIAGDLVAAGLDDLHVSVDGARPETVESIRRGAEHRKIVDGVREVLKARNEVGRGKPLISLRFCSMPKNAAERDDFWAFWNGILGESDEVRFDGLQVYEEAPISDAAAEHPCIILWKRLFVRWNGDYAFCCNHRDNRLGIRRSHDEKNLREMWHDGGLEWVRARHMRGRKRGIDACRVCPLMAAGVPSDDPG